MHCAVAQCASGICTRIHRITLKIWASKIAFTPD